MAEASALRHPHDASAPDGPGGTLLVVDDEPLVLRMMHGVLSQHGHRVLTAERALDALRVLDTEPVDVLIADLCMPGVGGVELLAETRRQHPAVRRIAFSGANDVSLAKRCVNDGQVHRYLTKPSQKAEIVSVVQNLLNERRREIESAASPVPPLVRQTPYIIEPQRMSLLEPLLVAHGLAPLAALLPPCPPQDTTTEALVQPKVNPDEGKPGR